MVVGRDGKFIHIKLISLQKKKYKNVNVMEFQIYNVFTNVFLLPNKNQVTSHFK